MNIKELFCKINKIEEQLQLENFCFYGIDLWPHIREQIIQKTLSPNPNSILNQGYAKRIINKAFFYPIALLNYLKINLLDFKKRDKIEKREILFFTTSIGKRIKYKNKWYDSFIDPLIDKYQRKGKTYLILERSTSFTFKYPRYRKSKIIQLKFVSIFINSLLKNKLSTINDDFIIEYTKLYNLLIQNQLPNISLSDLKKDARYMYCLSRYFQNILTKVTPEKVYLVPWYGYTCMALCHACNEKKINSIDIQHGVQGKYHRAYGYWNNIPHDGFNTQPKIFLTWTKEDSDNLKKWTYKTNLKVYTIGNLMEENFLLDTEFSKYFDLEFNRAYYKFLNKKFIIVSLQIGHDLPEIVNELIHKNDNQFFWLIRHHPSTTKKERLAINNKLKNSKLINYEIDSATKLPIYCLLRNSICHITKFSSTVIEAANFQVKSIIIDDYGKELYDYYIKSGEAIYSTSSVQIYDILKHI